MNAFNELGKHACTLLIEQADQCHPFDRAPIKNIKAAKGFFRNIARTI